MVIDVVWACVFTAMCWWFGTGVILWLDRLPPASFRWSLLGWTMLLILSFKGVYESMREVSVANAYLAFGSVIVMWGWHELAFLTGWITGPRKVALTEGAQGWQRFKESVQVMLHHEVALLLNFGVLWLMQKDQPNHVALCTYALLCLPNQPTPGANGGTDGDHKPRRDEPCSEITGQINQMRR